LLLLSLFVRVRGTLGTEKLSLLSLLDDWEPL
jgi:hypothetical protein